MRSMYPSRLRAAFAALAVVLLAGAPSPVLAQQGDGMEVAEEGAVEDGGAVPFEEPAPERGFEVSVGFEAKAHFRQSDENRFPVGFPFSPDMLPPGETMGFLETVNEGSHLEISTLTLLLDASWGETVAAHAKVDFIDLYDRNPTSGDREFDVDEVWVRFGRETPPALLPERPGVYLKVGKMPKFERQDDRHLESYGLLSTAFNRFEDTGLELGADLGRYVYVKGTVTQGNPVFFRDPNALAGDNGNDFFLRPNPDPELKSGIPILYDAEVEDLDVDGEVEIGVGLGFRLADEFGDRGMDLLLFGYERELAETVELEGTFYGGDLDTLRGPLNLFPPAGLEGNEKEEYGANLWVYLGGFTFFGQYVDQELAGLPRSGFEGELAWRFDLPLAFGAGGEQLFPWVQPAVRYSSLENDFTTDPASPSPSFGWDWQKLDLGLRLGILSGLDVTLEYADNTFETARGDADNNEFLATLRWAR